MRKIISLLMVLFIVISINTNSFISEAKGLSVYSSTVYIDKGEDIITATKYNNDFISISSDDESVAKASFNTSDGSMTIKGLSKGNATITLRLGNNVDYKDYIYPVTVISTFDNVTFSYDYDKVTIKYASETLPEGCRAVFSIDGINWSDSPVITRNKANDGAIYKTYKVNDIISGSLKVLSFDTKYTSSTEIVEKTLEMNIDDTYDTTADLDEDSYSYHLFNGRSCAELSDKLVIKATDSGNTKLTIVTSKETDFDKNGSYSTKVIEYVYSIKVADPSADTQANSDISNAGDVNNGADTSKNNNSSNNSSSNNNSQSSSDNTQSDSSIPNTEGTWIKDSVGWWFSEKDGSYPVWDWIYIDDKWYFFDRSGYMASSEYRFGCWLNADGSWNYSYSNGTWKSDSVGWWYEDNGWYPTDQWLKIDGYWYYFKSNGYMASDEYIDGYWLGSDGAWR